MNNEAHNTDGLICFHVDLRVFAVIRNFAPEGNYIGSLFAKRCIELMFDQARVEYGGPGCYPQPLNQCSGLWKVGNVAAGLKTLQEALSYLDLLQERFTEIGFFDPREEFWRNVYPANSRGDISRHFGFALEVFVADMTKRSRELGASMRSVVKALEQS